MNSVVYKSIPLQGQTYFILPTFNKIIDRWNTLPMEVRSATSISILKPGVWDSLSPE